MKPWRMVIQLLQDMANLSPEKFMELNEIAKEIILAHYEEIYG